MSRNFPNSDRRRRRYDENHNIKRNKRLKTKTVITPWRDQWELQNVGMRLASFAVMTDSMGLSDMSNEQALESVAVWRSRSSLERLPHSIEATAALAQVIWSDSMSSSSRSISELRLSFSSAIVRCINGFADVLQQQRSMAGSISMLCGQLGIPSWLVDIRHEASHNSLPSLDVLRLAATTLMEFLQKEYWVQTCGRWDAEMSNRGGGVKDEAEGVDTSKRREQKAMDLLLQYKAGAAASQLEKTRKFEENNYELKPRGRKKKTTMALPEVDQDETQSTDSHSSSSSSDDFDEFEDAFLGNIWTTTLGTNTNRFAALESTKSKPKEKSKKQTSQKSHKDYANEYVRHVPIQLGFSVALAFFVWGGMGGAPSGRGVLIPGSTVAFPASENGIKKARDRYSPLILALCREWPGFAPALLVHVVDFLLSLEDSLSTESEVDIGTVRKLYFLSSWVGFLLSRKFVNQLHPGSIAECAAEAKIRRSCADIQYAPRMVLEEEMQYPLNSLCDRCDRSSHHGNTQHCVASLEIFEMLNGILDQDRVKNFGIQDDSFLFPENHEPLMQTSDLNTADDSNSGPSNGGKLSLAAMEAMLAAGDESEFEVKTEKTSGETGMRMGGQRLPWVRCASWDTCSIGTLPGFPV